MLDNLLVKGWLIGFSIAMPVGPIAMLCIQHSLNRGMTYGLVAGLGAALADTLYGALAAFGVTLVAHLLANHQLWLQLVGSIFLCYIGVTTLYSKPSENGQCVAPYSLKRAFITTFFLTLTNPLTFLGFTGIYAALGIGLEDQSMFAGSILIFGVFIGSAMWWLMLSCGTAYLGKKMQYKPNQLLQKVSGSLILTFGILTSLSVFQQVFMS